jgi:hypothetical protein
MEFLYRLPILIMIFSGLKEGIYGPDVFNAITRR